MVQMPSHQWINNIGIAIILLLISCSTISMEQLFEEYYEKPILNKRMLSDTTTLLQKANTAYQNNDFKNAIQHYETYLGQNPEAFDVELSEGIINCH